MLATKISGYRGDGSIQHDTVAAFKINEESKPYKSRIDFSVGVPSV